jgi:hypothetical protein
MELFVREGIEIELHPYNISREGGLCLSKSWKPLIGYQKLSGYDPVAFATWFRILKRFYKHPAQPFHRSLESRFVV